MVDRQFAYAGAIPQNTDVLSTNKNVLYGLGHIIQAALGTGTSVVGLVGAQSTIPDLHITVGPGAIYSSQTVDASAYGDLGIDANTVMKQGILKAAQTLTLTPPGTSGYSQVYLVQATYSDTDGGATVLPYYNSSNPSVPYAGPANAGTSNYTVRQGLCTIALKAGTAAPTGSQTTPSADSGYLPLYTITLVNGQTAITTAQIIQVAGSFVPYNLNNLPFGSTGKAPGALITRRIFTSTQTYTPTAGTNKVRVTVVGGGAGGGGSQAMGASQFSAAGGGGAGEVATNEYTSGFSGVTMTIGAGGAGVSGSNGNAGGATSFGALLTANGGIGGAVASALTIPQVQAGGAGGSGGSGAATYRSPGGTGASGVAFNTGNSTSGFGGSSYIGAGASAVYSATLAGIAATSYGAGGSGACGSNSGAAQPGGAGAGGCIIVEEYA